MNQLTLEWIESSQNKSYTFEHSSTNHHPGTLKLGRDPSQCDLIFQDQTISGLQAEILFDPSSSEFRLRNLRPSNPPRVDGNPLTGEITLKVGTQIYLGRLRLTVTAITIASSTPQTILFNPAPPKPEPPQNPTFGLKCPKCLQISTYNYLDLGCPWCGTSLAAAVSVIMP